MGYVKGIEPKEIIAFHLDMLKDKKDAVYVKYLSNGVKIIVLVVDINSGQDPSVD